MISLQEKANAAFTYVGLLFAHNLTVQKTIKVSEHIHSFTFSLS